MRDDTAQFKLHFMGVAMILYQHNPADQHKPAWLKPRPTEVTLLVPQHITQDQDPVILDRCLIVLEIRWSVALWMLNGPTNSVPLYGLPIIHPWCRFNFRQLDNNGPSQIFLGPGACTLPSNHSACSLVMGSNMLYFIYPMSQRPVGTSRAVICSCFQC